MFHFVKLALLSAVFPEAAKDLGACLSALVPEKVEQPRTDRVMVCGPRGPYYVEKKYL